MPKTRTTSREIIERVVITGMLVLDSPAHFGNGDADAFTDMPLLRDEMDRSPLLPGTSLAGALRNYLYDYEQGYPGTRAALQDAGEPVVTRLFGGMRGGIGIGPGQVEKRIAANAAPDFNA